MAWPRLVAECSIQQHTLHAGRARMYRPTGHLGLACMCGRTCASCFPPAWACPDANVFFHAVWLPVCGQDVCGCVAAPVGGLFKVHKLGSSSTRLMSCAFNLPLQYALNSNAVEAWLCGLHLAPNFVRLPCRFACQCGPCLRCAGRSYYCWRCDCARLCLFRILCVCTAVWGYLALEGKCHGILRRLPVTACGSFVHALHICRPAMLHGAALHANLVSAG